MMHDNFFKLVDINKFRSLICLNGSLPDKTFFNQCLLRPLIAVDGSANQLLKHDLQIDLVIGDLDSISKDSLQDLQVLHLPHQSQSDFEKLINYANQSDLFPAIVLGVEGGYLDHILNNINLFSDLNCIFYAPPILGLMIKPDMPFQMTLAKDTKISLIPLPSAVVDSQGLKWELNQSLLSFPGQTSCFNRSKEEKVNISVREGQVLVLLYTVTVEDAALNL